MSSGVQEYDQFSDVAVAACLRVSMIIDEEVIAEARFGYYLVPGLLDVYATSQQELGSQVSFQGHLCQC